MCKASRRPRALTEAQNANFFSQSLDETLDLYDQFEWNASAALALNVDYDNLSTFNDKEY